ncbi:LysE family transporter [Streptomyces sp. NPDC006552]|uniref:LysE family transporter n=1 Tax=Streptomyces sp. NPDC006552 TaxID=3157179 RepID=UPI0033B87819
MSGALVAGVLAGYGIAVPVGAVGAYLVSLSARTNLRTGACAGLGVATADGLYALAAVAGGAALAPVIRSVRTPLSWAAAAVLLALAVQGGVRAVRGRRAGAPAGPHLAPGRAYAGLLGLTLLNPMTVLYFAALVLGGGFAAEGLLARAAFAGAAFAASASWQLLLAGGGALLGRALTGARGRLVTGLVSSALIAGFAVRLVWAA